jgi:hypothetical protein
MGTMLQTHLHSWTIEPREEGWLDLRLTDGVSYYLDKAEARAFANDILHAIETDENVSGGRIAQLPA